MKLFAGCFNAVRRSCGGDPVQIIQILFKNFDYIWAGLEWRWPSWSFVKKTECDSFSQRRWIYRHITLEWRDNFRILYSASRVSFFSQKNYTHVCATQPCGPERSYQQRNQTPYRMTNIDYSLIDFWVPNLYVSRRTQSWWRRARAQWKKCFIKVFLLDDKKNVRWLNIHELVIVRSNLKSSLVDSRSNCEQQRRGQSFSLLFCNEKEERNKKKVFWWTEFSLLLWQVFNEKSPLVEQRVGREREEEVKFS